MSNGEQRWAPLKTLAGELGISSSTARRHVRGFYVRSGRRVRLARWKAVRIGCAIRVLVDGDGAPVELPSSKRRH